MSQKLSLTGHSPSSGALRHREASDDYTLASNAGPPQRALSKEETIEKIFFAVLDVSDGKRYKVFLRPDDISRLKVSKIRKTLSSASGKPPFSFVLWLGGKPLLDNENDNCAALGINTRTLLRMCPNGAEMPQNNEEKERGAFDDNKETTTTDMPNTTGASASRVNKALREMLEDTEEVLPTMDLNQRQRELQIQLYEEAKQCRIFSANDAVEEGRGRSGDEKKDSTNVRVPTREGQTTSYACNASSAKTQEGNTSEDHDFTLFLEEILNTKATPQGSSSPTRPSEECHREKPDELQTPVAATQSAAPASRSMSYLETISQGVRIYDMYAGKDATTATLEKTKRSENAKGTDKTMPSSNNGAELEVMKLVEDLKDDINNLLALQVRSETTKRALQRELYSSQKLAKKLEKKEETTRQQLDALLLQLRDAHSKNGVPVFSEEELRAALCNVAASHQNKLLQRENAALEQRLAEEVRRRREMVFALEDMKGQIRVLVRVRPPFRLLREQKSVTEENKTMSEANNAADEARMAADEGRNSITITDPRTGSRQFNFYRVFSECSTQTDVFSEVAPLVQLACDGVNVSVLAYGQTGSGKTYTIFGAEGQQGTTAAAAANDVNNATNGSSGDDGIVPRALRMLFEHLRVEAATEAIVMQHAEDTQREEERVSSMYEVSCSLLELYNDKVQDLLAPPQVIVPAFHLDSNNNNNNFSDQRRPSQVMPRCSLKTGPDGNMCVVGLTQHVVRNARDALKLLHEGASRRQVHATQQNPYSSRSHLIFTVHLTQKRRIYLQNSIASTNASSVAFKQLESKLVFADLAGSERIAKSQSVGDRLLEARHINKSLAALGDVVATLSNAAISNTAAAHVPYRNSTLTALLQDVIGNRSKTVLLACVAPSDPPYENHTAETVMTLQFASRVRCVRNVAPPFPSTGTNGGGGSNTKGSVTQNLDPDMEHQHTSSSSGRGAMKMWMRPTQSSRQKTGAVGSSGAIAANESDRTEEGRRANSPALQQPQRANDSHAEQPRRMRF